MASKGGRSQLRSLPADDERQRRDSRLMGERRGARLPTGLLALLIAVFLPAVSSTRSGEAQPARRQDVGSRRQPAAHLGPVVEPVPFVDLRVGDRGVAATRQAQSTLIIRHDLKGTLTWLTIEHPPSWFVDPNQMAGVQVTSEHPEDIASWYGRATTATWGTVHLAATKEAGVQPARPEPGLVMTTTAVAVDGYPGVRYDYQDAWGRVDSAITVTLPSGETHIFNTEIAGDAAGARAMRVELDRVLASIDFIADRTQQVGWTRSLVTAPSPYGNGFSLQHPSGWAVAATAGGGVALSSPATSPYAAGELAVQVEPASAADAARWVNESRAPYYMFQHETRTTSTAGLATPLLFVPSAAYLVRTNNDGIWLVAVGNPAKTFGTSAFWFYDQTLHRVTTASSISYVPVYP